MELTWIRPLHGSAAIITKTVVKTVDGLSKMLLWGWLPPVEHRAQHDQSISYRNQPDNSARDFFKFAKRYHDCIKNHEMELT
jgi:hypothetical protein